MLEIKGLSIEAQRGNIQGGTRGLRCLFIFLFAFVCFLLVCLFRCFVTVASASCLVQGRDD